MLNISAGPIVATPRSCDYKAKTLVKNAVNIAIKQKGEIVDKKDVCALVVVVSIIGLLVVIGITALIKPVQFWVQ